jgi:hypothetical protein
VNTILNDPDSIWDWLQGRMGVHARDRNGYASGVARAVVCADGFVVSVQASRSHYCVPKDNFGPWTHVEVAFPTSPIEGWGKWRTSDSVWAAVPVPNVIGLLLSHGGVLARTDTKEEEPKAQEYRNSPPPTETENTEMTHPEPYKFQPGDRVRMVNPGWYANLAPVGTICTVARVKENLLFVEEDEDLDLGGTYPWRWELVKEEPTETPKAPKPLVSDETARDLILALEAAHAALCAAAVKAPYTMNYIKDVLEEAKEEVRGATGS